MEIKDKLLDFLKRKYDWFILQRSFISKHTTEPSEGLEAVVPQRIAKFGKPHMLAETLILPAVQDIF